MRGQRNLSFPPLMGNSPEILPAESVSRHQAAMVHEKLTMLTLPVKGGTTASPDMLMSHAPLASPFPSKAEP